MDNYREIENLIYRAALVTDEEGPAACCRKVFEFCKVAVPDTGEWVLGPDLADDAQKMLKCWGDSGLRTQHRVSNVIIEVDDKGESASATSYLTMMQAVPEDGFPLQAIGSGVYHDTFERRNGSWVFATHRLDLSMPGDLSRHVAAFDDLPLWQLVAYRLSISYPWTARFLSKK